MRSCFNSQIIIAVKLPVLFFMSPVSTLGFRHVIKDKQDRTKLSDDVLKRTYYNYVVLCFARCNVNICELIYIQNTTAPSVFRQLRPFTYKSIFFIAMFSSVTVSIS